MGGGGDAHLDRGGAPPPAAAPDAHPGRLELMRRAFADALRRHPGAVREDAYAFAGRPVRLRVVGVELAARTQRAFAHLRGAGATAGPRLEIDLWDEAETGVSFLAEAAATELDRSWIACDGTITATPDGRYVSFRYQDSVTILDRHQQRMVSCRRSGATLSSGEHSKPYVLMLSIWFHDRGVQVLHCGLVARRGAGVLLPGASGTGKSTTALTAVTQGLEFLGDDFVGLECAGDGGFVGHSLFNSTCLVPEMLDRFPDVPRGAIADGFPGEEKPILFLSEIHPERVRATVPLRAIVLLRIRQPRTEIRPASRAEALRELAASTLHTVVPRPGRDALEKMAALVERVPAFWLRLGPDRGDIAPSLDRILSRLGHGDAA